MSLQIEKNEFARDFAQAFGSSKEAEIAMEFAHEILRATKQNPETYISHNIGVAKITLDLGLRREVVIASLLHNLPENGTSIEKLEKDYGKEIAQIIESKARFENAAIPQKRKKEDITEEMEKEDTTKKLYILLTTNPDVVMLQLAEMLDKLRKIESVPEAERKTFISEIVEIYAPLSHKLNVYSISSEMNELAFRIEQPKTYHEIEKAAREIAEKANEDMSSARENLLSALQKNGIKCTIAGRVKSVYSTYAKMKRKSAPITKIYDLLALRVVTQSIKDCYEALGIIHTLWKPIPGEFDDYIAKPKPNGYKSLHTSVRLEDGKPIEIQLRTSEMNDFAELGIASHWHYKGEKKSSGYDKKIEWIKQVIEWQRSSGANTKMDIFGKEIFALTPKGNVIELPHGATIIDFAYAVHSDIGEKCVGGKVNGIMAALNTEIKNGDVVEILTSDKQVPKAGWLNYAKTSKARGKIIARLNLVRSADTKSRFIFKGYSIKTSDRKARIAKCCSPLPGDDILGIKTTKRKISVHRSDCVEIAKNPAGKIKVDWDDKSAVYDTSVVVEATDRIGILKDILNVFSSNKVYLATANAKANSSNQVTCSFVIRLKNVRQFEEISRKIRNVKGVVNVKRE